MKLARRLKSQEKSGIFFSPELDPKENTSSIIHCSHKSWMREKFEAPSTP